jgi:hypothetical protein
MNSESKIRAEMIVEYLLDRDLAEATVRRPPRGTRWIAVYTGVEPGKQVWRSTGLTDRAAALAQAKEWELGARRDRAAQRNPPRKPRMRVRRGSEEEAAGLLTQAEVAAILGISVRAVREIERRAFEKLRRHPALRRFWREYATGDLQESAGGPDLSRSEINSLFGLARTALERRALRKLLAIILADQLLDT